MLNKYSIFCLFLLLHSVQVYSQGAWNIKYVPVSSIDKSLIGKDVRIDFKASNSDTISRAVNALTIRRLLSHNDTVNLKIDSTNITFLETWEIYVDQGSLKDQILMSTDGEKTVIKEICLIYIDDLFLIFEISIYQSGQGNSQLPHKQKITIDKSIIKGLLW